MTGPHSFIREMKNKGLFLYVSLKNFALDKGVFPSHSSYMKFLILGRSRTGSAFLRGLLNSHTQIEAFGELFRDHDAISWGLRGYPQTKRIISLFQNDPIGFLKTKIFRNYPKRISAIGFKIFYYHAQNERLKGVWTYLRDQQDIRIIHIKRRNTLETHLSRKRAGLTDLWDSQKSKKLPGITEYNKPIPLDYDECLEDFTRTRIWEREFDVFFHGHSKINVEYEDLAVDYKKETKRILEFLELNYEELKPETSKQSHLPLSKAISNYAELKEGFKKTPWEEFFKE